MKKAEATNKRIGRISFVRFGANASKAKQATSSKEIIR